MKLPTLEEMRAALLEDEEDDNVINRSVIEHADDERFVRDYYSLRVYQKLHPKVTNKDIAQFIMILFDSYQLSLKDILDINKTTMAWFLDVNSHFPEVKESLREELRTHLEELYDLKKEIMLTEEQINKKKIH